MVDQLCPTLVVEMNCKRTRAPVGNRGGLGEGMLFMFVGLLVISTCISRFLCPQLNEHLPLRHCIRVLVRPRRGARTRRIPLPLTGVRIVTQFTITSIPPSTARRSKPFFVCQAGLENMGHASFAGQFPLLRSIPSTFKKNKLTPSSFACGKCRTNNVQSLTLRPDAYQEINYLF